MIYIDLTTPITPKPEMEFQIAQKMKSVVGEEFQIRFHCHYRILEISVTNEKNELLNLRNEVSAAIFELLFQN